MGRNIQRLVCVEIGLAAITGVLTFITPIFPDWIEFVSGWDPDQHDGSMEWMIVVGLFLITIGMIVLAAIEWRRTTGRSIDIAIPTTPGRNVQKQSRSSSSCFEVIVAEHSAESLTPLDSGVRFANGAERPQQPVF